MGWPFFLQTSSKKIFKYGLSYLSWLPGGGGGRVFVSRSEVRGFKSPMTHRNFCNHNLITNVALGIYMTMRANKNLHSQHIRTLSPQKKNFKNIIKKRTFLNLASSTLRLRLAGVMTRWVTASPGATGRAGAGGPNDDEPDHDEPGHKKRLFDVMNEIKYPQYVTQNNEVLT